MWAGQSRAAWGCHCPDTADAPWEVGSFGRQETLSEPTPDNSSHLHTCSFYPRPLHFWSFRFPSAQGTWRKESPDHSCCQCSQEGAVREVRGVWGVEKDWGVVCKAACNRQQWLSHFSGAPSTYKVGAMAGYPSSAIHRAPWTLKWWRGVLLGRVGTRELGWDEPESVSGSTFLSLVTDIHGFVINYLATWPEHGSTVNMCRPWAPGGLCLARHRPFGLQAERSLVYRSRHQHPGWVRGPYPSGRVEPGTCRTAWAEVNCLP